MKKDTNYVAAVEKAIAEKYGKDTVQDFRSEWSEDKEKEYLDQIKNHNCKTKNKIEKQKDNRVCPTCKTYSFSGRDDLYMNRFETCRLCYYEFIEHNENNWKQGWRPTREQIRESLRRRNNG